MNLSDKLAYMRGDLGSLVSRFNINGDHDLATEAQATLQSVAYLSDKVADAGLEGMEMPK